MIFGLMMLDATETNLQWNLAVIVDGAMITVLIVKGYFCGVMLQVSYSVISCNLLTIDGIAMAISRMALNHFLWKKPYSAGTLCPNYAVYG